MLIKLKSAFLFYLLLTLSHYSSAQQTLDLKELLSEPVNFTGPNCFNTALRFIGVQQTKYHVTETEIEDILLRHCTTPKNDLNKNFGLIRSYPGGTAFHAFIPLDDNLVLTKNGFNKIAKNEIQNFKAMFNYHNSAYQTLCSRKKIKDCFLIVEYFNCTGAVTTNELDKKLDEMYTNREMMFSVERHKELLDIAKNNIRKNGTCFESIPKANGFYLSLEYANYASITTIEYNSLNQLSEDLKSICNETTN